VVGSTAVGVGIQRPPVLFWKVGRGSAGGQSPTCEYYRLIISDSTRLSVRTPVINVSDKLFLLTVWFYCG